MKILVQINHPPNGAGNVSSETYESMLKDHLRNTVAEVISEMRERLKQYDTIPAWAEVMPYYKGIKMNYGDVPVEIMHNNEILVLTYREKKVRPPNFAPMPEFE